MLSKSTLRDAFLCIRSRLRVLWWLQAGPTATALHNPLPQLRKRQAADGAGRDLLQLRLTIDHRPPMSAREDRHQVPPKPLRGPTPAGDGWTLEHCQQQTRKNLLPKSGAASPELTRLFFEPRSICLASLGAKHGDEHRGD